MDEEKESERRNNLSYDEMIAEGLIIPARNPQRIFTLPKGCLLYTSPSPRD